MNKNKRRSLGANAIDRLITQQLADRKVGKGKDKNKFENAVSNAFKDRKRRRLGQRATSR